MGFCLHFCRREWIDGTGRISYRGFNGDGIDGIGVQIGVARF